MTRQQTDAGASAPLPDAARTFLEPPRFATISTLDPDGFPHQAVTWYVVDGDGVLINSRAERHWPRNLRRDPRISIAVYDMLDPQHWVGLKGSARLIREGDAALADIMALARRYGGNPDKYRGQNRVTFLVDVEHVFEYEG